LLLINTFLIDNNIINKLEPQNIKNFDKGTFKCHKHIKWSYRSNVPGKNEKFGYVATSPDGTFVIAAGVVEGEKVFFINF